MLRMEIALFMVLAFVACVYFSAGRKNTPLHRTFSVLLVVVLAHLALDGVTVYTVHHLEAVPRFLNDAVHRLFLGSMVLVIYLFYQYIAILVEDETGKPRRLDWPARIFLAGQFSAADHLHGDPGGELFLRALYAGALWGCGLLSAALRRTSGCESKADRQEEKVRYRDCPYH